MSCRRASSSASPPEHQPPWPYQRTCSSGRNAVLGEKSPASMGPVECLLANLLDPPDPTTVRRPLSVRHLHTKVGEKPGPPRTAVAPASSCLGGLRTHRQHFRDPSPRRVLPRWSTPACRG